MQWEVLEAKIGNWIHFMRIAVSACLEFEQIWQFSCSEYMVMHEQVKLLYVGEWIVCDQIFEGFDSLRDQCFGEVIASSVSTQFWGCDCQEQEITKEVICTFGNV